MNGPSKRLAAIREDLLAAPYGLCTEKARLMTDYLEKDPDLAFGPTIRAVSRLHYRAYARSLESLAQGRVPSRAQIAANRLSARLYRSMRRRLTPGDFALKYAGAVSHGLRTMELQVHPHELLVGNFSSHRVGAPLHPELGALLLLPELDRLSTRGTNPLRTTPEQIQELREWIFPFWFNRSVLYWSVADEPFPGLLSRMFSGGEFVATQIAGISHLTPDYPKILEKGFRGLRAEAQTRLSSERDPEKRKTLEAFVRSAEGALDHAGRWAAHLHSLALTCADPARREELSEMARICERVPANPASTFREALQSIVLTHAMLHHESFQHGISFGRLDRYLAPFYRRDRERGILTDEQAVELLGCFLGKAAELLPLFFDRATEYFSGLSSASGITLGGPGSDPELAAQILAAYRQMRLRQPNLHARIGPETSDEFWNACTDAIAEGGGMPALFNDDAVIRSLVSNGVESEDASGYSVVGCAEWGVPGKSFPAAGAAFINLCAPIAKLLTEPPGTFDDFVARYRLELRRILERAAACNGTIERTHAALRPTPLLSLLVEGCVDKAEDVTQGGARINSSGFQGAGLADAADSLAVVDWVIRHPEFGGLERLRKCVSADFAADAEFVARLRKAVPRYGMGEGDAQSCAALVADLFAEEVARLPHPRGGRYLAGFWTMTTHQGFGRGTGALPNGRRARMALSNGISSVNGADRGGPTAAMVSASAIPHRAIPNGCVLNQKLDPRHLRGENGQSVLRGLVRGYFRKGGAQVQFNVVDARTLRAALKNPAEYRSLVVRISGYSAYFNDLTEEMKHELIERTEQGHAAAGDSF